MSVGETEMNWNEVLEGNLPLSEAYKLAFGFYKEKEGKAVYLSYEDKLQLVAFTQQVLHGPFAEATEKLSPVGALDVVGRDRRLAWSKLVNLTADQARSGFIELLSRRCPLFNTYLEAHRREKNEQNRLAQQKQKIKEQEVEELQRQEIASKLAKEQLERDEAVKRQIQQALNEQTYNQFRKYAEQQYPGEPERQGDLVRQLQDQHYIQYMQQLQSTQAIEKPQTPIPDKETTKDDNEAGDNDQSDYEEEPESNLVAASMWTRPDIESFKQLVSEAEGDGVVRVGHGETVTVRVPTHHEGSRLFWEFATDHYDIGFGVFFEYGTPQTDQVSVHVSESEDDEDGEDILDDDDEDLYDEAIAAANIVTGGDVETGGPSQNQNSIVTLGKPLLTQIVPVYRRDCQQEVYAGSHKYPGRGIYLLKFDNSYSLWRSKTLYYRVYYTQN